MELSLQLPAQLILRLVHAEMWLMELEMLSVVFTFPSPTLPYRILVYSGSFSLNPPSVPHFGISWYKEGGILTGPTIFGMSSSSLLAGGEAGKEAVLPLDSFYRNLGSIISKQMNSAGMEKYLAIIAENSAKGIYLDNGALVGYLLPAIDSELGKKNKLHRRLAV